MSELLTIVIPTYNRKDCLVQTLELFKSQILRNSDKTKLLVSNNASDDGTKELLGNLHKDNPFFDYINWDDHEDIGVSITRSNDLAKGEYILMWGDDDYPFPNVVDSLLENIEKHPNVALIHFNRLRGLDLRHGMKNIEVQNNTIGSGQGCEMSVKECIEKYVLDMSFLTTDVFRREFWEKNKEIDCSKHYGYEFLGRILHGMDKEKALYIEFPMCIQRMPAMRSWMLKSPLFRFIGIPNMYNDFEKWGLVEDAKALWMKQGNTKNQFLVVMFQASMYKDYYRPLYKEIISHQHSFDRKAMAFFFIYLCPGWLYKVVRKMKYKTDE